MTDPQNQPEDTTPKGLIEKLKSDDTKSKSFAIRNIQSVATAIGMEKTRKELLPYLINCIDIEEDEALIELAKVMGGFIDYIGGKAYGKELLPVFEMILSADDAVVRKEAILSLKMVLTQLSFSDIETETIEMIKRISTGEEVANKISCINVIALTFHSFNDKNRSEAMVILNRSMTNSSAMVRAELAAGFNEIAPYVSFEDFQLFLNAFISDDNDAIRIQIIECMNSLREHKSVMNYMSYLTQILKKLGNDESWRVRLTVGDHLSVLASFNTLSSELKVTIIDVFAKLLEDPEPEVRNICCLKLETITEEMCKEPTFDQILSKLKLIEKDTTSYVRTALASTLLRICTLIGTNKTNEFVFPVFLNMMKDENHDIRMILIKTLDQLHEVVNIDNFIQGIIPSFNEISSNKNWRIRIQVSETIPVLARILSKKLFIESILSICITWLTDPVFAIRESACKLMKKLYDIFKGEDFDKRLLEKMNEMRQSDSYLVRNTVLFLIKEFLNDEFNQDFVERKCAPFVLKLCKDKTSNIRMNCAIILKKMTKFVRSKDIIRDIQNHLDEMKLDKDYDVVYAINDN